MEKEINKESARLKVKEYLKNAAVKKKPYSAPSKGLTKSSSGR